MTKSLNIFDTVILVGFNPEGGCVYSEKMEFGEYYDHEHVWDTKEGIQRFGSEKFMVFFLALTATLNKSLRVTSILKLAFMSKVGLGLQTVRCVKTNQEPKK